MTEKNIRRLFPCDDSMVVVIDDRADVWTWSPNLIKVHPCKYFYRLYSIKIDLFDYNYVVYVLNLLFIFTDDFFVGIGDINDTYLPKVGKNFLKSQNHSFIKF